MAHYIYQNDNWTSFTWDELAISELIAEVHYLQGRLAGYMQTMGFAHRDEARLSMRTLDVVKSSEIEGEHLDYQQVRSSIAKRLGIDVDGIVHANRYIDGVVEMMLDATHNYQQPLTEERLFGWHASLFPTGRSGPYTIEVGRYRTREMQIVSGAMGKEKVHYEAPDPKNLATEMSALLKWINAKSGMDPVIKAAVAHLWFIIIHPFDDGNGRIARALTDLLLSPAEEQGERFYSMSNQIMSERKRYYEVLQKVQHSRGDITEWLDWFLKCLKHALMETETNLNTVMHKARFWAIHQDILLNARQRTMLNKLLDGFDGKLKTSKWAKITKCSPDTALRDIKDLIGKGILRQETQGGRSTNYELVDF